MISYTGKGDQMVQAGFAENAIAELANGSIGNAFTDTRSKWAIVRQDNRQAEKLVTVMYHCTVAIQEELHRIADSVGKIFPVTVCKSLLYGCS